MIFAKGKQEPKYIVIKELYEEHHWSISWMCHILKISRASYYKWLNRKETKEELEYLEIAQLVQEYDERFNHILGYRRMTRWINKFNHKKYSKRRIKRIMDILGIKSVIRKKKAKNIFRRDYRFI